MILIVVLVMSSTMIGFGLYFDKKGPSKINFVFGYRTPMSMKNLDTWKFGNVFAGRLMWRTGCVLLAGSLAALLFTMNSAASVVRIVGLVIIGVHALMIFGAIILTEIALRRTFDRHGNRKGQ